MWGGGEEKYALIQAGLNSTGVGASVLASPPFTSTGTAVHMHSGRERSALCMRRSTRSAEIG